MGNKIESKACLYPPSNFSLKITFSCAPRGLADTNVREQDLSMHPSL